MEFLDVCSNCCIFVYCVFILLFFHYTAIKHMVTNYFYIHSCLSTTRMHFPFNELFYLLQIFWQISGAYTQKWSQSWRIIIYSQIWCSISNVQPGQVCSNYFSDFFALINKCCSYSGSKKQIQMKYFSLFL